MEQIQKLIEEIANDHAAIERKQREIIVDRQVLKLKEKQLALLQGLEVKNDIS